MKVAQFVRLRLDIHGFQTIRIATLFTDQNIEGAITILKEQLLNGVGSGSVECRVYSISDNSEAEKSQTFTTPELTREEIIVRINLAIEKINELINLPQE